MMKRNTLVAVTGLLVAAAAVGTGALVSRDAMASGVDPTGGDEMTLGMIVVDGTTAVECTFTGEDLRGLLPTAVPAAPSEEAVIIGAVPEVAETGVDLPDVLPTDALAVPADGQMITGAVPHRGYSAAPGGVADVRDGSPEECDAMRATLLETADLPVESSGQVAGTSGTESVITP